MGNPPAVISSLLMMVGAVMAQTAQTNVSERLLPQWLTGIIAVVAFLFLTFVSFLVKKAWCDESSGGRSAAKAEGVNECATSNENSYEISLDMVRSKDNGNVYDNPAIDTTDEKLTAM
ncbi:PDZK1-interacting protein 1 isoform X2 [Mastacembelus armatus]|uniref:PDZK1-interacting protein 1 isoform X2 n=1 Tax=Mastacembelus armatus TaxID=205130 RepID=UPI000E45FB31|nr:proximal tubules-expressed gene protein-like isoform X2 [Mastacembelus armatus]